MVWPSLYTRSMIVAIPCLPLMGSKTKIVDLVLGVAYHDACHAGQIQLLKRLRGGLEALPR